MGDFDDFLKKDTKPKQAEQSNESGGFGDFMTSRQKTTPKTSRSGQITGQEIDELLNGQHGGKVRQFFNTVKQFEGGAPNLIVGGKKTFDPNGDHPNIVGLTTAQGSSTAAGNYQITGSNWYKGGLKKRLGATNFSEENQLKAAIMLFADRDNRAGLNAIINGDYATAEKIAAKDWAALPSSKLHPKSFNQAKYEKFIKSVGGQYNPSTDLTPKSPYPVNPLLPKVDFQTGGDAPVTGATAEEIAAFEKLYPGAMKAKNPFSTIQQPPTTAPSPTFPVNPVLPPNTDTLVAPTTAPTTAPPEFIKRESPLEYKYRFENDGKAGEDKEYVGIKDGKYYAKNSGGDEFVLEEATREWQPIKPITEKLQKPDEIQTLGGVTADTSNLTETPEATDADYQAVVNYQKSVGGKVPTKDEFLIAAKPKGTEKAGAEKYSLGAHEESAETKEANQKAQAEYNVKRQDYNKKLDAYNKQFSIGVNKPSDQTDKTAPSESQESIDTNIRSLPKTGSVREFRGTANAGDGKKRTSLETLYQNLIPQLVGYSGLPAAEIEAELRANNGTVGREKANSQNIGASADAQGNIKVELGENFFKKVEARIQAKEQYKSDVLARMKKGATISAEEREELKKQGIDLSDIPLAQADEILAGNEKGREEYKNVVAQLRKSDDDFTRDHADTLAEIQLGWVSPEIGQKRINAEKEVLDKLREEESKRTEAAYSSRMIGGREELTLDKSRRRTPEEIRNAVAERFKEIKDEFGGAEPFLAEQKRNEEYWKTPHPFGQSSEALKTITRYMLKIPSTILDATAAIGEINPVTAVSDYLSGNDGEKTRKQILQLSDDWRKKIDDDLVLKQNPVFRKDFLVNEVAEMIAQVGTQIILAPLTGGYSLALPFAEAATSQYKEADSRGAGKAVRLGAAAVGGVLALPDVFLKAKYLRFLPKGEQFAFLDNIRQGIFRKLLGQFGKEEAEQITRVTMQSAIKNGAFGIVGESSQEWLEDIGNTAYASQTYAPEKSVIHDALIPNMERARGYAAAGIGGAFGATFETATQKMTTDQLTDLRDSLPQLLEENRITQHYYDEIAQKINQHLKTKNADISAPNKNVGKSVDSAVQKLISKLPTISEQSEDFQNQNVKFRADGKTVDNVKVKDLGKPIETALNQPQTSETLRKPEQAEDLTGQTIELADGTRGEVVEDTGDKVKIETEKGTTQMPPKRAVQVVEQEQIPSASVDTSEVLPTNPAESSKKPSNKEDEQLSASGVNSAANPSLPSNKNLAANALGLKPQNNKSDKTLAQETETVQDENAISSAKNNADTAPVQDFDVKIGDESVATKDIREHYKPVFAQNSVMYNAVREQAIANKANLGENDYNSNFETFLRNAQSAAIGKSFSGHTVVENAIEANFHPNHNKWFFGKTNLAQDIFDEMVADAEHRQGSDLEVRLRNSVRESGAVEFRQLSKPLRSRIRLFAKQKQISANRAFEVLKNENTTNVSRLTAGNEKRDRTNSDNLPNVGRNGANDNAIGKESESLTTPPTSPLAEQTIESDAAVSEKPLDDTVGTKSITDTAQTRRDSGEFTQDGNTYKRQTAGITTSAPTGKTGKVQFSGDNDIDFEYQLIEADKLQPSHLGGNPNMLHFIPEMQPKTVSGSDRKLASDRIAEKPDFNKLAESPNAYGGAPVINERGEVVQGNNRSEGVIKHYSNEKTQYKDDLAKRAADFGFSENQVKEMNSPVLVRKLNQTDAKNIELGNFTAQDIETGGVRRIEPRNASARISFDDKVKLIDDIFGLGGDFTVNELIRNNEAKILKTLTPYLNDTQRHSMLDAQGKHFTPEAVSDIEKLVTQFLFDDGVTELPNVFDALPYQIKRGITGAFPSIFKPAAAKSIIPELQNAMIAAQKYREQTATNNAAFDEWRTQGDLFTNNTPSDVFSAPELAIAKKLLDARTQSEIKQLFKDYAELVSEKNATMFEDAQAGISKADAVREILGVEYAKPETIFKRNDDRQSDQAIDNETRDDQTEKTTAEEVETAEPSTLKSALTTQADSAAQLRQLPNIEGVIDPKGFFRPTNPDSQEMMQRRELGIPPAWTDVQISDNPNARVIAKGRDGKGRLQMLYSAAHSAAALVEKFERQRKFNAALPGLLSKIDDEIKNSGAYKEEAATLRLIAHSGFRVGSDADTGGKVKAYGASNLKAEYVIIEGGKAHFDFIGKLGVRQQHTLGDTELVNDLLARKQSGNEKLFDTSDTKIRAYLKKITGKESFKVHDFRTWNATDAARQTIAELENPTTPEQFWKLRDVVGDVAAVKLGDTRKIVLESYIDPLVFEDWRTNAGVGENDTRPKNSKRTVGKSTRNNQQIEGTTGINANTDGANEQPLPNKPLRQKEQADETEPSTLKSALTDTGAKSQEAFYSAVERTIENSPQNKFSAEQIKALLNPAKGQGIKQEELSWLGIDEFIDGKDKITKDEILDFVRMNRVEISEVVKDDAKDGGFSVLDERNKFVQNVATRKEAQQIVKKQSGWAFVKEPNRHPTKFSQYTLPGGKEYKEWVFTLPQEILDKIGGEYNSSHFPDVKGYLLHVRGDVRTTADGLRTLHVAELQSDLHQDGRKKGYQSDNYFFVAMSNGQRVSENLKTKAEAESYASNLNGNFAIREAKNENAVPDFPFKKSWHELAFKKILHLAAENNFDAVTWDTGTIQNERYDLSKQVDSISYGKNADGTYNLEFEKDGKTMSDEKLQNLAEKDLPDAIGKEVANKIIESGKTSDTLTGDDLKIEGAGMKGFYDKILPSFANKFGKKFGARVGTAEIVIPDKKQNKTDLQADVNHNRVDDDYYLDAVPVDDKTWTIGDATIVESPRGTSYEVRLGSNYVATSSNFAEARTAARNAQIQKNYDKSSTQTVHSLPITDSMRESVLAGQPLFRKLTEENLNPEQQITFNEMKNLRYEDLDNLLSGGNFSAEVFGDRIHLNARSHELLRRTFEETSINKRELKRGGEIVEDMFAGVFLDPSNSERVVNLLREKAAEAKDLGYLPNEIAAFTDLADAVEKAAEINTTTIPFVFEAALPEEMFHQADYMGAQFKAMTARTTPESAKRSDAHPITGILEKEHFSKFNDFKRMSRPMQLANMRAEIPPFLRYSTEAELRALGITPEMEAEYLFEWFDGYAEKNDIKGEDGERIVGSSLIHFEKEEINVQEFIDQVRTARSKQTIQPTGKSDGAVSNNEGKQGGQNRGSPKTSQRIESERTGESETAADGKRIIDAKSADGSLMQMQLEANQKLASLPATLRRAGIEAADVAYDVFADADARESALAILNEKGIVGAINYLDGVKSPDANDAFLSFIIQRMLIDGIAATADTSAAQADEMRVMLNNLTKSHVIKSVKAGRFTRAASVIMHTVEGVQFAAQQIINDKYEGEDKTLSPERWAEIEKHARIGEEALAKIQQLNKDKRNLNAKIKRQQNVIDGIAPNKRRSKKNQSFRKNLVDQLEKAKAAQVEKIREKLALQFGGGIPLKSALTDERPLAPNGKPSKLSPQLHKLVRTPEFLKWFGDWINNPKEASQVIDENGEPLVVYHGTDADFDTFSLEAPNKTDPGVSGKGFYFSDRYLPYGETAMPAFLNIKKPSDKENAVKNIRGKETFEKGAADARNNLIEQGYDGVIRNDFLKEYVAFNPNQIKSIFNQGTFSNDEPSILKSALTDSSFDEETLGDFAHIGAMNLTQGLSGATEYTPEMFHAEMVAEFGDAIGAEFNNIYERAWNLRNEWLKEIRDQNNTDRITNKYGEELEDWEIKEILGQEKEKAKAKRALTSLHKATALQDAPVKSEKRVFEFIDEMADGQVAEAAKQIISGKKKAEIQKDLQITDKEYFEGLDIADAAKRADRVAQEGKAKTTATDKISKTLEDLRETLRNAKKAGNKEHSDAMQKLRTVNRAFQKLSTKKTDEVLSDIISDLSPNQNVALAAELIQKSVSPQEIYDILGEDAKGADKRGLMRDAQKLLIEAKKEKEARKNAALDEIAQLQGEEKSIKDQQYKVRNENSKAQAAIAAEFRRIKNGEKSYYLSHLVDASNAMRSMMASVDLSARYRQGGYFSIAMPELQKKASRAQFTSFTEKGFGRNMMEIEENPYFIKAQRATIDFAFAGKLDSDYMQGEEVYRGSDFLTSIPILGTLLDKAVLGWSERTYTGFLDAQRMVMFEHFAKELESAGYSFEKDTKQFEAIGKFINVATGRGVTSNATLSKILMTLPLFAPRYTLSRLQLLNMTLNPVAYANLPAGTRKIVAKSAARFYGTTGLILGIAAALGAALGGDDDDPVVTLDPDSGEFGKIKVGNTRYDIFAGTLQPARLIIRLVNSAYRNKLGTDDRIRGEFGNDVIEESKRFVRGKLSPIWSLGFDYLYGSDYVGEEFSAGKGIGSRLVPLMLSEFGDAMELKWNDEDGKFNPSVKAPLNFYKAVPAVFGLGASTYEGRAERPTTAAEKLAAKATSMNFKGKASTAEEKRQYELTGKLRARSRKGEDVTAEIAEAFSKGRITEDQRKDIIDARTNTLLEEKASRLSLENFEAVLKVATDREKSLLKPMLDKKMTNAANSGDLKDDQRKRLESLGGEVGEIKTTSDKVKRMSTDKMVENAETLFDKMSDAQKAAYRNILKQKADSAATKGTLTDSELENVRKILPDYEMPTVKKKKKRRMSPKQKAKKEATENLYDELN